MELFSKMCNILESWVFVLFNLYLLYLLKWNCVYIDLQIIARLRSATFTCTGMCIRGNTEISCVLRHKLLPLQVFLHVLITCGAASTCYYNPVAGKMHVDHYIGFLLNYLHVFRTCLWIKRSQIDIAKVTR